MPSVLGVISIGSVVLAAAVMLRWAANRRDALGRERDLPVISVAILLLVAVLAAIPGARRAVEERRLGRVASVLAGKHVTVHCQDGAAAFVDAGSELGYVAFDADGVPEPHTLIKRDQCRFIQRYLSGTKANPSQDEVVAVHVLTHEAMHMRGQTSESGAECEAVQRDEITAHELGASWDDATTLARRYWQLVYPRMPDDYWTRACAPGQQLDEHLETAPWL